VKSSLDSWLTSLHDSDVTWRSICRIQYDRAAIPEGKIYNKVQLRGNCNGKMAMNSRVKINEVTINEVTINEVTINEVKRST
jgi:hypothetical protein